MLTTRYFQAVEGSWSAVDEPPQLQITGSGEQYLRIPSETCR